MTEPSGCSLADETVRPRLASTPLSTLAHYWYMQLLAVIGARDSALAHGCEALSLDPLSAVASFNYGAVARRGERDKAEAALKRNLAPALGGREADPAYFVTLSQHS